MPPASRSRQDSDQNGGDSQQPETGKNLPNKLVIVTDDVVGAPDPVSSLQRFRVHVPTPYTHFLLGERAKGTPTGVPTFGYTGVSFQTDGNLYIDVKEDTVIQNQGFTLMQTQDIWQQYSQSLMELSSPTAVKVVGGEVFLAATATVQAPALKENNGAALAHNTGNDLTPALTHLKKVGSGWDIGLSVLSLVATGVFFSPLDTHDLNSWIKTAETAWSTRKKLLDLKKKFAPPEPKKDMNIYGQDGVNIMTEKKVSITAEESMKVFATSGVTISSAASSTVMAVQGVKSFGGLKASLEGGTYADVKGGVEVGVSCLRGKLKLKGKKIEIGTDSRKWTQLPTDSLQLIANKVLRVGIKEKDEVEKIITTELKLGAKEKIDVESQDSFKLKAAKHVQIYVGDYAIEIKPDGIKIGKGGDGAPSDPLIKIDGETISLSSSGMGTKITKNRVFIGKEGTNMTVADSGTVFVKGNIIKLG